MRILVAGGDGFLPVNCPPECPRAVRHRLCTLQELSVALVRLGSDLVLDVNV
jgi:hypothetical protein